MGHRYAKQAAVSYFFVCTHQTFLCRLGKKKRSNKGNKESFIFDYLKVFGRKPLF